MSRESFAGYADHGQSDLVEHPKKNLPLGTWITFYDLDPATTEQDIVDMIAARTGVVIPVENIQINAFTPDKSGAIISIDKKAIHSLISWALMDDNLLGRKIRIRLMPGKR